MKKIISLIMCLTISVVFISCSKDTTPNEDSNNKNTSIESKYKNHIEISIDGNLILENLKKLCENVRNYGSFGEKVSADYLKGKLEEYGYIVEFQEFPVYKQTIDSTMGVKNNKDYFKLNPYNSEKQGTGKNVIGKRDNHSNEKKTIYLTAHYDTTDFTKGVIDNGTGTAVILEVARQLRNYHSPFNIEMVFFSAEEYCRSGSRYFVSKLTEEEKKNTLGCINVDMVGEKGAGDIVMGLVNQENNVMTVMLNEGLENKLKISRGGSSDDLSFYHGEIPAITLLNKKPNFKIDKKEDQFPYVDLQQLKNTAYLISNFLTNFNMDTYNKIVNKDKTYSSNKKVDKLGEVNGFKLNKISAYPIKNGYDSITEYEYINKNGKKYIFTEQIKTFINLDDYGEFKSLDKDNNWLYSISKDSKYNTKVFYCFGIHFGEIKGDISIDEAMKILKIYSEK
ncbi:M20/M25/M40 family metallo-hydrolase [Clostridium tetani]|uniref:M20/M25/M40 family metallo-hydrolase n=1 Tax=Clostridium tetani TaxID=1513 RepID=UPI0038B3FF3F